MDSDGKILVNLTRASVVCEHIEIADRPRRRMRGLLGRDSLEPGEGMLLQPAPSIHTAFMRFAIDVVFLDGTLRVMKVIPGLRPWRMAGAHHAWGVAELASDEVERRGVAIGDQLGVVSVTDKLGEFVVGPGGVAGLVEPADGRSLRPQTGNGLANGAGAHATSQAAKVLLVGADRRFRSVAAALLARRGCAVIVGDRTVNLAELVRREAPDVVVLDAGASLTDAAHGVAQLERFDGTVGLVVVGEELERGLLTMPVLPKWGSFDRLFDAVERAQPEQIRRTAGGRNG